MSQLPLASASAMQAAPCSAPSTQVRPSFVLGLRCAREPGAAEVSTVPAGRTSICRCSKGARGLHAGEAVAREAAGRGHPARMPCSRAQPGPGRGPRGGHALAGRGADVPRDARRRAVARACGRGRQRERRARGGAVGREAGRHSPGRGGCVSGAARQRPAARGAVLGHVRQRSGGSRWAAGAGRRGRARALWRARAARGRPARRRRAVRAGVRGPDGVGAQQPGQPGVPGHAAGRARARAGAARRAARGGHPLLGDGAGWARARSASGAQAAAPPRGVAARGVAARGAAARSAGSGAPGSPEPPARAAWGARAPTGADPAPDPRPGPSPGAPRAPAPTGSRARTCRRTSGADAAGVRPPSAGSALLGAWPGLPPRAARWSGARPAARPARQLGLGSVEQRGRRPGSGAPSVPERERRATRSGADAERGCHALSLRSASGSGARRARARAPPSSSGTPANGFANPRFTKGLATAAARAGRAGPPAGGSGPGCNPAAAEPPSAPGPPASAAAPAGGGSEAGAAPVASPPPAPTAGAGVPARSNAATAAIAAAVSVTVTERVRRVGPSTPAAPAAAETCAATRGRTGALTQRAMPPPPPAILPPAAAPPAPAPAPAPPSDAERDVAAGRACTGADWMRSMALGPGTPGAGPRSPAAPARARDLLRGLPAARAAALSRCAAVAASCLRRRLQQAQP